MNLMMLLLMWLHTPYTAMANKYERDQSGMTLMSLNWYVSGLPKMI